MRKGGERKERQETEGRTTKKREEREGGEKININ